MSSKRSSWKRKLPTAPLCLEGEPGSLYFADLNPADGGSHRSNDKYERKTRQLCEQVSEAVSLALAACHDPLLCDLYVEAVEPAPGASRLRVTVSSETVSSETARSAPAVLDALERARAYLRRQCASEISRKRTPQLVFVLLPPRHQLE